MKLRIIALTALAALTLTACSKGGENGGEPSPTGKNARMGITLKLPVNTRAWDDDVNATTAESEVKSITVYIFNASNGSALTDGGFTHFSPVGNYFDETSGVYTLKNAEHIKTFAGGAKIYVAANLPANKAIAYPSETLMLAAFDDVKNLDASTNPATGFTMFSEVEQMTLIPFDENNPTTTTSKVTISLDRVVSKLVGSSAAASYTQTWPSFDDVAFKYDIKGIGVYHEAIKSYLAKNTATLTTVDPTALNTFANSKTKPNATVAAPHPTGETGTAALTGFYIGENTEGSGNATYGKTTYAMVATTVTIDMAADWDTVEDDVVYTTVTPYGGGTVDEHVYLIKYDGVDYVTDDEDKASDIVNGFIARDNLAAGSLGYYTYTDGWVHFQVYLNREGHNDYDVARNQFVHVKVNGVLVGDGKFPGYPGDPDEPEKPIDPTDPTDPNNPDPVDPTDPIDPDAAVLDVEISINKWTYKANETILQ